MKFVFSCFIMAHSVSISPPSFLDSIEKRNVDDVRQKRKHLYPYIVLYIGNKYKNNNVPYKIRCSRCDENMRFFEIQYIQLHPIFCIRGNSTHCMCRKKLITSQRFCHHVVGYNFLACYTYKTVFSW